MPQSIEWSLLALALANIVLLVWLAARRTAKSELLALQAGQAESAAASKAMAERIERQRIPVPAHAMHSRNPRRSRPSSL